MNSTNEDVNRIRVQAAIGLVLDYLEGKHGIDLGPYFVYRSWGGGGGPPKVPAYIAERLEAMRQLVVAASGGTVQQQSA